MNRRAQGISVNVIIIAAVALVVMVILIALVLNTGSDINAANSCSSWGDGVEGPQNDYMCVPAGDTCPGDLSQAPPGRTCAGSTEQAPLKCCVDLI